MPFILSGSGAPQGVTGSAAFTAHAPAAVRGSATFSALPAQPVTGSVTFTAYPPLTALSSALIDTESEVTLTGLPGTVFSWAYDHSGLYEELEVTVDGLHGLAEPIAFLEVISKVNGTEYARLPTRVFSHQGQEPQTDEGRNRTTFRFRNDFDQALRGVKLPELIPWRLEPPKPGCAPARRTVNVSALIHQIMRDYVDFWFVLDSDLPAFQFEENRRDYSTLGKTPQQVWDETFGALGMVLTLTPRGFGNRLAGRWVQPHRTQAGAALPPDLILTRNPQRENRHTPARLTLRGGDHVTDLTPAKLLEWVRDDPAYQEIAREVALEGEYIDPVTSSGTARTVRGWRKTIGQLVAEIQITTDDVTVQETVDGVTQSREFRGVATGYTHTQITLDPLCPSRPLRKITRTKSWAYGLSTELGSFSTTGPGLYWNLTVGDLTADELTDTTYTYSPQGHQATETESSTALASVQQEGAELPPAERGAVQAREYVRTVKRTSWQPTGAGRWQRITLVSRQKLVPLYDLESGDAIRTQLVTSTLPLPTEVTDQAPPSFECNPCPKEVRDPTGAMLSSGDAGFGEAREVTLDFLRPAELIPVARAMLTNDWHRIVTRLSLRVAVPYHPGTHVNGALVQGVRISQAESDLRVTTELTTAQLDTTLLSPSAAGVYDLELPDDQGRSVMLAGMPGGARVRLVKGWKAEAMQPDTVDAFVAFRTGFPPRPGEEIDWTRYAGRLEARNAR